MDIVQIAQSKNVKILRKWPLQYHCGTVVATMVVNHNALRELILRKVSHFACDLGQVRNAN